MIESELPGSEEAGSTNNADDSIVQKIGLNLKQRLSKLFAPLNARFLRWREYSDLSGAGAIARRAFANNSFDGVLTMVGVVMGSFVVGVNDASTVLVTGLSTAVAIGISGGWGAYLTESAEREHEITELQKATLSDLHGSKIDRAGKAAVVTVALVDGLSPFFAAFFVVIPFFLAPLFPEIKYVFYASLGMALLALFGLGVYLAGISEENKLSYGLKTTVAGIVCMGITLVMERLSG